MGCIKKSVEIPNRPVLGKNGKKTEERQAQKYAIFVDSNFHESVHSKVSKG